MWWKPQGQDYVLALTDQKDLHDQVWEQDGLRIVCDVISSQRMDGCQLDFRESNLGRGFVFLDPAGRSPVAVQVQIPEEPQAALGRETLT